MVNLLTNLRKRRVFQLRLEALMSSHTRSMRYFLTLAQTLTFPTVDHIVYHFTHRRRYVIMNLALLSNYMYKSISCDGTPMREIYIQTEKLTDLTDTWRKITSSLRRNDAFDVIITLFSRQVSAGEMPFNENTSSNSDFLLQSILCQRHTLQLNACIKYCAWNLEPSGLMTYLISWNVSCFLMR